MKSFLKFCGKHYFVTTIICLVIPILGFPLGIIDKLVPFLEGPLGIVDKYDGKLQLIIFGFFGLGLPIILFIIGRIFLKADPILEDKKYKNSVQIANDEASVRFYREAVAEKITDMSKESDKEHLALFAKQKGILGTKDELVAAFNRGKEIVDSKDKEKRIRELTEKEDQKRKENRAYLEYYGRDKYIHICKDKIRENERIILKCKNDIDKVTKGGSSLYQKERDWAITGGIASGIAGGAAGVATAIDTQVRNSGIRANNQAASELIYASFSQVSQKTHAAKREKEIWEEKLKKAERLLIEERNEEELFKLLDFEILEKKKSETGVGCVRFKISQKPFRIYNDIDAKVDGSIRIIIKNGGQKTGEGIYVMREDLWGNPEVICDPINMISDPFNVEFAPNKLWAIEKI